MNNDKFLYLIESNLEKSEVTLAVQSIADNIQDMVKKLSKVQIEDIGPLMDRIKASFGIEKADEFNHSLSEKLTNAIEQLTSLRNDINTEALKISGDVAANFENDFSDDEDEVDDTIDQIGVSLIDK